MTKLKLLGTAALLTAAIATPAMAQQVVQEPGVYYLQQRPWATDYDYRYGYYRRSGFWPGDVAAAVVGGAVVTAGAIATAPLRSGPYPYDAYAYFGRDSDDTFAYYNDRPVSRRTTCGLQSGATYMGPDGRWYPC